MVQFKTVPFWSYFAAGGLRLEETRVIRLSLMTDYAVVVMSQINQHPGSATAPELAGVTGRYYDSRKERQPSRTAQDAALAGELWQRSVEWTGLSA